MTQVNDEKVLEALLKIAKAHGEDSEPDHEVGDLQDLLRPMWALLTPEQRGAYLASEAVRDMLEGALVDEPTIADIGDVDVAELEAAARYLGTPVPAPENDQDRISAINAYRIRQAAEADPENERFLSGNWSHIFTQGGPDTHTRIVFDKEENRVVAMELHAPRFGGWIQATRSHREDVTDSIVNANPEALTEPENWGLSSSDAPPMWSLKYIEWPPVASLPRQRGEV